MTSIDTAVAVTLTDFGSPPPAANISLTFDAAQPPAPAAVAALTGFCDRVESAGPGALAVVTVTCESGVAEPWASRADIQLVTKWERALHRLERLDAATVAVAAGGPRCGGLGLEVLLACDHRVAHPDLQLVLPIEISGVWPGMVLHRLVRAVGAGRARSLLLQPQVSAARALELGLLDEVAGADEVVRIIHRLSTAARGPASADLAVRRRLLLDAATVGFTEALGAHLAACDRALRRAGDEPPVVAAAARPAAAVVPQPDDGADLDLAWWAATAPAMTGVFSTDRARLASHLSAGGQALAALAPPRERSAGEKLVADTVHATSRALRAAFVRAHAAAIYDCATAAGPPADGLAGLVFAVADPFPGLVPDRATMAVEHTRRQADKEGWEIDQAILISGLLATADPGDRLLAALRRPTARALALRDGLAGADELTIGRVHLAVRGTAAHLTVANPDALNAEDTALTDDLETAVDLALLDPRVTVGVLRGAPMSHPRYRGRRVFSAGINLRHLAAGGISFVDFIMRRELGLLQKIARGLLGPDGQVVEKPWLAAVDSFAIGGGAQLLTVFDRVIAAADSYVSLPAAQEGIIPGAAQLRLGRSGYGRAARRAVLAGQRIWAREPDAALFFDEIVDPAAMEAAIEAGCRDLCGPAVVSNRRMLHLAAEPGDRFREYMSEFAREQSVRMYSADVLDKAHRFAPAADPSAQEGA